MLYPLNEESLSLAARAISSGALAAFPTETVYGLGGDAFNPLALAKIFEAKGRPRFDPLIVHIAAPEALGEVADCSLLPPAARDRAARLTAEFWPGPLTLILPRRERVPDLASSGLPTVAVRFPAHPAAQQLILRSTGAVAAPSANRFGCLSPTRAEHVAEQLGDRVDIILDGGPAAVGVESTVLDMLSSLPRILRPGGVSRERLESLIGPLAPAGGGEVPGLPEAPRSPGTLKSHYAPRTPLSLYSREEILALPWGENEARLSAWLFFDGPTRDAWLSARLSGPSRRKILPENRLRVLSETGAAAEAAANLFTALHELDRAGTRRILAQRAPAGGLGEAINDRLFRASR
ncbi:MAG: threonylcarbamoyl-AMP synthase [Treponema sp.]|jgi:L-threonylcarbamoyladenylate synthase|nr:threonylcarbamoyl-AMP synthase [Treponema sp.]